MQNIVHKSDKLKLVSKSTIMKKYLKDVIMTIFRKHNMHLHFNIIVELDV